jgi:hypothetical protein
MTNAAVPVPTDIPSDNPLEDASFVLGAVDGRLLPGGDPDSSFSGLLAVAIRFPHTSEVKVNGLHFFKNRARNQMASQFPYSGSTIPKSEMHKRRAVRVTAHVELTEGFVPTQTIPRPHR